MKSTRKKRFSRFWPKETAIFCEINESFQSTQHLNPREFGSKSIFLEMFIKNKTFVGKISKNTFYFGFNQSKLFFVKIIRLLR